MSNRILIKQFKPTSTEDSLQAAIQTAQWVKQYEHKTEKGIYFDILPGKVPEDQTGLIGKTSLYGGSAGIALFYLRLFLVTEDVKWLNDGESALDYIISDYKNTDIYSNFGTGTGTGIGSGLMGGPTGGAYVAELYYQHTKNEKYRNFAIQVTDDLVSAARNEGRGITWSGVYSVIADGGLILYLAHMYKALDNDKYLETAKKAAYFIADKAEEAPQGGLRWYAMDTVSFGFGEKGYFPGFFYGAAGSAYILARIYELTGEQEFLEKAKLGAKYIENIAVDNEQEQAALVQYNDPYEKDIFYIGMCQGPVGTSRLFKKLYEITKEDTYKDWVVKLTNGILSTGAPKRHSDGYWHTYCYCCGAAGMLEHFLSVYDLTGDEQYLEAAKDSVDVLIRDSYFETNHRRWYTAWNRKSPNEVDAYTGLYHGSTGCASSLLEFYNHETVKKELPGYIEEQ